MRAHHLASLLVASSLLAHTVPSWADSDAEADASIGTTPAAPSERAPSSTKPALVAEGYEVPEGRGRVQVATDPPTDWAVLHAGLRPHLGTFGGIATLALAHARTERFYGGFSLSAIRNDAGTHVGLTQLSLGRNLSDEFYGGAQLSLTENRARTFVGLTQLSLAYNRSLDMIGLVQFAGYNRAKTFGGGLQLGAYNRADKSFGGGLQLGAYNRADTNFTGLAQLGVLNHAQDDFTGIVQLGVVNGSGEELFEDHSSEGKRFAGLAQIGLVDSVARFRGAFQLGAVAFSGVDFAGGLQIGALGAVAHEFRGLAQIGLVTTSIEESYGAQIGAGAIAVDEHHGVQLGVLGNYGKHLTGAQIGLANVAEEATGIQIGVFNSATRLRGLQIGLVNHAEDGVLPWTALLNMGFGDGDGGRTDDLYRETGRRTPAPSSATTW